MQDSSVDSDEEGHSRVDTLNGEDDALSGLKLKQFDVNKINLDSLIIVIGKRRFGKTTWTQWVLYFLRDMFPRGAYCFTSTKHNYFWQQHIPDSRVYEGFQADVVKRIFEEQKVIYEKFLEGEVDKTDIPYVCLILDDVIGDHALRFDEMFDSIAFSGRHYFIFTIVCTQDIKGINPKIRQNADIVAFTYQTQERSIEQICSDYADIFADKNQFKEVIKENTQDFQLLVIDQANAHFSLEDVFFVSKAEEEVPPYKLGGFDFWKESGCDWKEQLKKARNKKKYLDSKKREDWEEIARRAIRKDHRKEKDDHENEKKGKLESNQECYAPEELQEVRKIEIRKKIGEPHVTSAFKKLSNLHHYLPGPRLTILSDTSNQS